MGDISIKGQSPLLNVIDKRPNEDRFPRRLKRRQKAIRVKKHTVEKPEPQPKLPTKKQQK